MPIIRRKLEASSVYPDDIRYDPDTDTVQRNVNGVWQDAPESDPRDQTTLPPRLDTPDPRCDAAQSVVDAIKGQIDGTIEAIDNAATAFTIAGIILSFLSFGLFAIFITIALGIADAMIGAGSAALIAALTEPVYDELKCILYCNMNAQGRLIAGKLPNVQAQVTSDIGGLAATIINSMLSLAGEGGINNLASLGESEGDCDACSCAEWCFLVDFTLSDGGFAAAPGFTCVYTAGQGWGQGAGQPGIVFIEKTIPSTAITQVALNATVVAAAGGVGIRAPLPNMNSNPGSIAWTFNIGTTVTKLTCAFDSNFGGGANPSWAGKLTAAKFKGTGTNPLGVDNCPPE